VIGCEQKVIGNDRDMTADGFYKNKNGKTPENREMQNDK
jgi:hypothetical protein